MDGEDRDSHVPASVPTTLSLERRKSWNHQESNFRHFEQCVGLMRELWRASNTSLKQRGYDLHYSCPSSFVCNLCIVLGNEGSQWLLGFFFLLFNFIYLMQFQLSESLSQISQLMNLSQNQKSQPEGCLPAIQVGLHWNCVWDSRDSHEAAASPVISHHQPQLNPGAARDKSPSCSCDYQLNFFWSWR